MNGRVLVAGWHFAGLLALDAVRAEGSSAAPVRGLIAEADSQGCVLLLDSEDVTCPLPTDAPRSSLRAHARLTHCVTQAQRG